VQTPPRCKAHMQAPSQQQHAVAAYESYLSRHVGEFSSSLSVKQRRSSGSVPDAVREIAGGRVLLNEGVHIRVHFDNYAPQWDEWYSQADLQAGELCMLAYMYAYVCDWCV
jgi:hypothetical protein